MISFVIPYFNDPERYTDRSDHLHRCLKSLNEQSDDDFEVIICEDDNHQIGKMLNKGVKKAKGSWIHFSQADFVYPPDHVERLKRALEEDTLLFFDLIYPWGSIRAAKDGHLGPILSGPIQKQMDALDFYYPIADGLDGCIEKSRCPKFDEEFKGSWCHYYVEWLYRVYKQGTKFAFIPNMKIFHPYNHFIKKEQVRVSEEDQAVSWRHFMELIERSR